MKISRELALKILKFLLENPNFYFPFKIVCKGYEEGVYFGDDDFVEVIASDDYESLLENKIYNEFELWEDLQNLDKETLKLMSKGFIEKILKNDLLSEVEILAKEYRNSWNENLWESENIEEFGFNEFIGGKAEAYEECVEIIKRKFDDIL